MIRTHGVLTWVAGPKFTDEDPAPVGMVFTYTTDGGVAYEQVDPKTGQSRGVAQCFRVCGKAEDGRIPLEPVRLAKDGTYQPLTYERTTGKSRRAAERAARG